MYQEDNEEDAFYTRPAINLIGTVLFQIKFFLLDDTTEVVNAIVPEFFVNKFLNDFNSFVEDAYNSGIKEGYESVYDIFSYLPDLDFDVSEIESGDIEWALNVPVTGFPGWLDGYGI